MKTLAACLLAALMLFGAGSALAGTANALQQGMTGVTVIPATEWQNTYPDIYDSYQATSENSEIVDYLSQYPFLSTIYEDYGFSKYYGSARGHYYCIEDVTETGRPHALANCFTCKTADFTRMTLEMGDAAYSVPFEDALKEINESVGCFTCHANDPTQGMTVTHTYVVDAMGEDFATVDGVNLSCAQCHVEYYFKPENKATALPYTSLAVMNPDDMYEFYEAMDFADYTNPRTGVRQLKAQHPEFETFLGAGTVHGGSFNCATCHMEELTNAEGVTYKNHAWVSPLESENVQARCVACHTDLKGFVGDIQDKMEARTIELGYELEALTNRLADVVATGAYTDDQLADIRALNRKGQWYWDFVFVENSEGAHNTKLDNNCLDKAEVFIHAANVLLEQL